MRQPNYVIIEDYIKSLDAKASTFADDAWKIAETMLYEVNWNGCWTKTACGYIRFLIIYLVTEPTETRTLRRLLSIIERKKEGLNEITTRCLMSDSELVRDHTLVYTKECNDVFLTTSLHTRVFH